MKKYSNLLKRSQALVLAVAIMLTVICPALYLNVSANEKTPVEKTEGEIVANNYNLTDAEKEILKSGMLAGSTLVYTVPDDNDGLVSVDIDAKSITAKTYKDNGFTWTPVSADLVVNGETKETVTLENGKGTYDYAGAAFAVQVKYVLETEVKADRQETLLTTPALLKQGVANMDEVAELSGLLTLLEQALPELVKLADNGIDTGILGTVELEQPCKDAIYALDDQMTANSGVLNLSAMIAAYQDVSGSFVKYLLHHGADVLGEVNFLAAQLPVIGRALATMIQNLQIFIDKGYVTQETAKQLELLGDVVDSLNSSLATIPGMDWRVVADGNGTALVQPDLTDVQYKALDAYVSALNGVELNGPSFVAKIENPLLVDEAFVQVNMSMYDVTVKVVLNTANGKYGETAPVKLTLVKGATADDIRAAVADMGIVADALDAWTDANVYVDGHFNATASALPEELTENIEYVITYSPKNYTVTYVYGNSVNLPYGSKITLEKHPEAGKAYDYTVDGTYYPEGVIYTVTGDVTIDRTEGKSYNRTNFYQEISNCFFASGSSAATILTSGALKFNQNIDVRYPDNDNGTLVVLTGDTLTAHSYAASYHNLTWVPYTYTVVSGTDKTSYNFKGANVVTITEDDYDRVEVVYQLVLSNFTDAEVLNAKNLPAKLVAAATAQKNTLNSLAAYKDSMGQLDRTKLGALNGVIDVTPLHSDPATNEALKAEFKAVVSAIINNCLDGDGTLKIYNMLVAYSNENTGGLKYYYKNSAAVINEINTLSSYLTDMLASDEKVAALAALTTAAGYPEYADKITELESKMASVKAALTAPDASIDLTSENLNKLATALENASNVPEFDKADVFFMTSGAISVNADSKATVSVTVQIGSGAAEIVSTITKGKGETLTNGEIAQILADVEKFVASKNVSAKFYTTAYKAADLKALLTGKTMEELEALDIAYLWSPVAFTVIVNGDEQIITIEDLTIDLIASTVAGTRHDYIIDGKTVTIVTDDQYTFTTEQVERLFVGNKYEVILKVVDLKFETLKGMVDDLNASTGGAIEFALIDKNGAYSIVMKVNAANTGALAGAAQGAAMGLVNSGYSYIGVDGNGFIYLDETNTMKISLQTIVDAVMNSGFGSDTIVKVMNANGTINNMVLDGTVVSDKPLATLGGQLIKTSMQLGNTAADAMDLPFYITLGSAPAALTQVRNLLAGQVGNYVNAECANGVANLTLTMPQKAYEAYLAVLLVTDNVDFSSINAVNGQIAVGFVKNLVDPLFTGNVTTTTLTNTLNKFGYNFNLSGYEGLWQKFCEVYGSCEFSYDEKSGMASGNVDIAALIDRMNLGELGKMIVEYEAGIDFNVQLTLDNIGTQFDALFIDVKANGIANKAGLTTNLTAQLSKMAGGAVVILLDDVDGDLTFNTTTVLNLNGYTVNGDLISKNNLIIVDTALDEVGEVTGTVSGKAEILGGKYGSDVSALLKEGYSQKDGVVTNDYFNIVKEEAGDINIELNAGILAANAIPDLRSMIVDVIAELIFNGYTTNALYLNENLVYNISLVDLVGLYASTNRIDNAVNQVVEMFDSAALANIINTILADATDFDALQTAVENGTPLMSYKLTTGAWNVALEHVTDGDYLTANLTSSNVKNANLNVVVTGSEEDKANLAGMLGVLAETVDADLSVEMTDGFSASNNKNFVLDWSASANVTIDFTNPDYAILISVMIADGIGADENSALVNGIEYFYKTGSMSRLQNAFNQLTIAQMITAFENIGRDDTFEGMLANLGLTDVVGEDVAEIEGLFDHVLKVAAALVRRADISGGSRTMASFQKGETLYGASKENFDKSFSRDLFKGYSVTMNLAVTEASLFVKMFEDDVVEEIEIPEFANGHGTPVIGAHEKLFGTLVDTNGKYIYLDAAVNGISESELLSVLTLYADNADHIEITVENKDGQVFTGAKLVAVASNDSTDVTDTVEYTIVVLGDVNKNGRIDAQDSALISKAMVRLITFTDLENKAADIGRNNRTDIGDAAIIAKKFVDFESYTSRLEG